MEKMTKKRKLMLLVGIMLVLIGSIAKIADKEEPAKETPETVEIQEQPEKESANDYIIGVVDELKKVKTICSLTEGTEVTANDIVECETVFEIFGTGMQPFYEVSRDNNFVSYISKDGMAAIAISTDEQSIALTGNGYSAAITAIK